MRVVTLLGSLGSRSANAAALEAATGHLRARGHEVAATGPLDEIPAFRAAQVDDPPPAVAQLRGVLESADAILVAAPEYAGGLAGVAKNALDWLVGSGSLYHSVVAVLSAGTTGGQHAVEQLVRTLSWQGALVVATLGIEAPATKVDDRGVFVDGPTLDAIASWADTAVDACADDPSGRLRRVAGVVTPYGIDPARFGAISPRS